MANKSEGKFSLDEAAKLDTSAYRRDRAFVKAVGADKDKDLNTDADYIQQLADSGITSFWTGRVSPSQKATYAINDTAGTSEKVASWHVDAPDIFDMLVPAVVVGMATAGFGSGLAGLAGISSSGLAGAAVKAGVGQAIGAAQGGEFSIDNFFKSLALKSLFPGAPNGS